MQMVIIDSISALLALLPLLMAIFFLLYTVPRKSLEIRLEISKLRSTESSAEPNVFTSTGGPAKAAVKDGDDSAPGNNGEGEVDLLMRKYFTFFSLVPPALILTILYLAAFLLCDCHIFYFFFKGHGTAFFSEGFLQYVTPILYAFLGVYVFNLGTMVRRVYLADMNEQVFWGAINRLVLSIALAVAIEKGGIGLPNIQNFWIGGYFAIGFMANIFLQYFLEKTLDLLNIAKPKRNDLPLQMVRGINLWKEYRLEEEGIESVQNLATANILEMAVRTHYNLRTLIDWIDQSIVLSQFTSEQIELLNKQGRAISAIDMAAASPKYRGSSNISDALARVLDVDPVLFGATLDSLFDDQYVQALWNTWQSGRESLHQPNDN